MKRLYKMVSISESAEGLILKLDQKIVKTPERHVLVASNSDIAQVVMEEWMAQGAEIIPESMAFTQILSTKFDRVVPQRDEIYAALLKYLDTDLLCYRIDHPPNLALQQRQAFDPWLSWFEGKFGVRLLVTDSIQALHQPEAAHHAVAGFITSLDDDVFNIFQWVTSISGSLILALAFVCDDVMPDEVFAAMRVDEQYKAGIYDEEKYGPEALQQKRDASIRRDLKAAAYFLSLL